MLRNYIYVFVRNDLSIEQQTIQTAHVTFEMAIRSAFVNSPKAVLVRIENLEKLLEVGSFLREKNIKYEIFHEPDIYEHTAIITYPLKTEEITQLSKFDND